MHPPLIRRPGNKVAVRDREQGVTLALVAIGIFSVIAMAALSIDVGTLYEANAEAQRAADAAAPQRREYFQPADLREILPIAQEAGRLFARRPRKRHRRWPIKIWWEARRLPM